MYGDVFKTNHSAIEEVRNISQRDHGVYKAIVSFDLVDIKTNKTYSFSKWFNVKLGQHKMNFAKIEVNSNADYESYVNTVLSSGYPPMSGYMNRESFDIVK